MQKKALLVCFGMIFSNKILLLLIQDLDPKGTGILRADDIPLALGTALYLMHHKLDPERYSCIFSFKVIFSVEKLSWD